MAADPTAMEDKASAPSRRQAALGFIFATALMDVLALGLILPVLPRLVRSFVGGSTAAAAGYVGVFGAAWAVMQFICSPIQGALSDRLGRRPVLLISIFGLGLDYVLMALSPNLTFLFVGRLISGATAASFSTANAYIADITPPERRAQSFGLMGTAFGVGFILGPSLGGLLGGISPRLPFWAAAGLALTNGLYGLFVLPESLPKAQRSPFSLAKANPIGSFRLLASHPVLLGLGVVELLIFLSSAVLPSTFVLYADYRYGWSTAMVGALLAGLGLSNILVQGFVVGPAVKRLKEWGALQAGLMFAALALYVYGWAPNGAWCWLGVPIDALAGLMQPGLQGLMTRQIGANAQGRLQGANSALMAVGGLAGPILFTQVFARSISGPRATSLPGAPFYLSAALFAIALGVALFTQRATAAASPAPA